MVGILKQGFSEFWGHGPLFAKCDFNRIPILCCIKIFLREKKRQSQKLLTVNYILLYKQHLLLQ